MRYYEIRTNKGRKCIVYMHNGCSMYVYVYGYKHFYYFHVPGLRPVRYTAKELRKLSPFTFAILKKRAGIRSYKGV